MKQNKPVDYLATIDQVWQEKQTEQHQIHDPDFIPACFEEPVAYLAISKVWEKAQAGKYTIYTSTGK